MLGSAAWSGQRIATIIGAALLCTALSACGYFDSQSPFAPGILRAKAPDPPRPDSPPDAVTFVKEHQAEIFLGEVSGLKVGRPKLNGLHWEFCVFAFVKVATGSTSEVTLVVETSNGILESRRRADEHDRCDFT